MRNNFDEVIAMCNKDKILDLNGTVTNLPMTRGRMFSLILAVALFIIFYFLPLDHIHPLAGRGLGLVLCVIILWVSAQFNLAFGALLLAAGSVLTGIIPLNDMLTTFGKSNFVSLMGMMILAMGATHTNFAKRIAYTFLAKLGNNPFLLLVAIGCATAFISAFCSNLATIILMSSIALGVVEGMNAEKQKDPFAKGLMISIPMFASIGGMALMSGSPAMNTIGVTTIEAATQGAYTIKYSQWAVIGVISAILVMFPTFLVYKKIFKINSSGYHKVDTSVFAEQLKSLGAMSGSEIRWCITTIAFVVVMLTGKLDLKVNSLLFACITLAPIVGTVRVEDALKSLPLGILLLNGFAGLISSIFAATNITGLLQDVVGGALGGLSAFPLMLGCTLVLVFLNNILPNATAGVIALCISAMTPVVLSLGFNPSLILLPVTFMGSYNIVLGMQDINTISYAYGYWKMNETILPNMIICIIVAVILSIVAYFVGPMIGLGIMA